MLGCAACASVMAHTGLACAMLASLARCALLSRAQVHALLNPRPFLSLPTLTTSACQTHHAPNASMGHASRPAAMADMLPDMPCVCLLCFAGGAVCALPGAGQAWPCSPTQAPRALEDSCPGCLCSQAQLLMRCCRWSWPEALGGVGGVPHHPLDPAGGTTTPLPGEGGTEAAAEVEAPTQQPQSPPGTASL